MSTATFGLNTVYLNTTQNDSVNIDMVGASPNGLRFSTNLLTSPEYIQINTSGIYNSVTGNTTSWATVDELPFVLSSLEVPPNPTTLQVENTVIVSDTPNNKGITIDATVPAIQVADLTSNLTSILSSSSLNINDTTNSVDINGTVPQITLSDGVFNPYISILSNRLYITGNSTGVDIDSSSSSCRIGDIGFTNNGTLFELDDPNNRIDLNARNLTCQGGTYTYPICFSNKSSGSPNYANPSSWEDIHHYNFPFPSYFADSINANNVWKIEFQMNCTNMNDQTNKELAMYIEFEDTNNIIYNGFLFNQTTPFTTHKNASTYTASSQQSENYGWTDYFDFTGMNGAVPLTFRLMWFANSPNNFNMNLFLTLTRTNLI